MNDLFRLFPKRRADRTPSSKRRFPAVRLHLESLEDRFALAVGLNNGVLSVVGTKRADTIRVDLNGANLDVTMNGVVTPGFPLASVRQINISGGRGNDHIAVGANVSVPARLAGGRGQDTLIGGAGDDVLLGERGRDLLMGGDGNDRLDGGRDNDILDGGNGNDTLLGGRGRDLLRGGPGRDQITGGRDRDTFGPNDADDVLTDFNRKKDRLVGNLPSGTPITPPITPPVTPPTPPPPAPPGTGPLPAVTTGSFTDANLLGTRTDLLSGAPPITQTHVETRVDYSRHSNPPTYGDHHASSTPQHRAPLQPTGVYTTPQEDEDALHNLEHGHVWISYNPDLIGADLAPLQELVRSFGNSVGVILTPRPATRQKIAVASWGRLQTFDTYDPMAIRNFAITNRGHAPEGFITP